MTDADAIIEKPARLERMPAHRTQKLLCQHT